MNACRPISLPAEKSIYNNQKLIPRPFVSPANLLVWFLLHSPVLPNSRHNLRIRSHLMYLFRHSRTFKKLGETFSVSLDNSFHQQTYNLKYSPHSPISFIPFTNILFFPANAIIVIKIKSKGNHVKKSFSIQRTTQLPDTHFPNQTIIFHPIPTTVKSIFFPCQA